MTIEIKIPSDNKPLALAIGQALVSFGGGALAASTTLVESEAVPEYNGNNENEVGLGDVVASESTVTNLIQHPDGEVIDAKDEALHNEPEAAPGGLPTHDEKGVPHIPAVCGKAAKPFYASGPLKGQWKRKVGITEENYTAVYANALNQVPDAGIQTPQTQTDASTVFGGDQTQQAANTQQQATTTTPQAVFDLYSQLIQAGKADAANAACAQHGLANGTLIYSRPDLASVVMTALQAVA